MFSMITYIFANWTLFASSHWADNNMSTSTNRTYVICIAPLTWLHCIMINLVRQEHINIHTGHTIEISNMYQMYHLWLSWTCNNLKNKDDQYCSSRKIHTNNTPTLTPLKTNMTLENHNFQKEIHLQVVDVLASHVSFRGSNTFKNNQTPTMDDI